MKIINEPRYQDFNGKVHKTEKECINAENAFVDKVYRILDELATGCENHGNACKQCPFYDNIYDRCYIEKKIGNLPYSWHIEEEE
jgi:hypothetical protein